MNLGKPKIHSYTNGWNVVKTYGAVFFFNFGGGIEGGTGCFFFFPFVVAAPGGGIDGGFGVAPVFGGAVPGGPGILLTSPEYALFLEGWGGLILVLAPGGGADGGLGTAPLFFLKTLNMDDFFCGSTCVGGLAFSFFKASNSRFISANCFATSSFKLEEVEPVAVFGGGAEFGSGGAIGRFFDVDFDVDL